MNLASLIWMLASAHRFDPSRVRGRRAHRLVPRPRPGLELTPSAVSHAIRKLEQTLGASLFERDKRVVRLSARGRGADAPCRPRVRGSAARPGDGLDARTAAPAAAQRAQLRRAVADSAPGPVPARPSRDRGQAWRPAPTTPGSSTTSSTRTSSTARRVRRVSSSCRWARRRSHRFARPSSRADQDIDGSLQPGPDRERDQAGPLVRLVRRNGLPAPRRKECASIAAFSPSPPPASGLGVALESTRLAEREIASGRLVAPPGRPGRGCPLCRAPPRVSAQHAPASQFAAVHDVAGD